MLEDFNKKFIKKTQVYNKIKLNVERTLEDDSFLRLFEPISMELYFKNINDITYDYTKVSRNYSNTDNYKVNKYINKLKKIKQIRETIHIELFDQIKFKLFDKKSLEDEYNKIFFPKIGFNIDNYVILTAENTSYTSNVINYLSSKNVKIYLNKNITNTKGTFGVYFMGMVESGTKWANEMITYILKILYNLSFGSNFCLYLNFYCIDLRLCNLYLLLLYIFEDVKITIPTIYSSTTNKVLFICKNKINKLKNPKSTIQINISSNHQDIKDNMLIFQYKIFKRIYQYFSFFLYIVFENINNPDKVKLIINKIKYNKIF